VAGTLWPAGEDERAAGNLRSALWRLRGIGCDVLSCDKSMLRLAPGLLVDVQELDDWAQRLVAGQSTADDLRVPRPGPDVDLLPGWYDDWVVFERERLRQRVMHALEALSRYLAGVGRYGEAVDAALVAVGMEPLRESAREVLIQAHLDEHNHVEASRAFFDYARLVRDELGVAPSRDLAELLVPRPPTAMRVTGSDCAPPTGASRW
jgi:DNA-binding SARP family transcriptional activator